jgi:hypothetical protein
MKKEWGNLQSKQHHKHVNHKVQVLEKCMQYEVE